VVWAQQGAVGDPSLWVTNATGTGATRVVAEGYSPVVAPDGHSFAFMRRARSGTEGLHLFRFGVGMRRLAANAPSSGGKVWSADGRRLLWTSLDGRLVVMDVATGTRTRPVRDVLGAPVLAPDGSVLLTRKTGMRGLYARRDVFRFRPATGALVRLTTDGRSFGAVQGPGVIAYAHVLRDYPDGPSSSVRLMAPDGTNDRPLVEVPAGGFGSLVPYAFASTGGRLLGSSPTFVSEVPSAIDPATGAVRALVGGERTDHTMTAGFSRDGSVVLAILRGDETPNGRLVALAYDTGRVVRVYAARAAQAGWAG
jgi:hypothetical protein